MVIEIYAMFNRRYAMFHSYLLGVPGSSAKLPEIGLIYHPRCGINLTHCNG